MSHASRKCERTTVSKTIVLIHGDPLKSLGGKLESRKLDLPRLRYPRGPIRGYAEREGGKGEIVREAVGNQIDGTGSSGAVMGRAYVAISASTRKRLGKPRCTHVQRSRGTFIINGVPPRFLCNERRGGVAIPG